MPRRRVIQEWARRGSAWEMDWIRTEYPGASMAFTSVDVQGRMRAPVFNPLPDGEHGFVGSYASVQISTTDPAPYTIRYTTDGSEPDETSAVYDTAVPVPLPGTLKARIYHAALEPSSVTEGYYEPIDGTESMEAERPGASMAFTGIEWQPLIVKTLGDADTEKPGASMAFTEIVWQPLIVKTLDDADTEKPGASMAFTEIEWQYTEIIEV